MPYWRRGRRPRGECALRYHREALARANERLALPEAIDAMTDWGDAALNEKARNRTWATPPLDPVPPALLSAEERLAAGLGTPITPAPPLWPWDKGDRIIPPPGEGGS